MTDVRHATLVMLCVVVIFQTLFVLRFGLGGKWRFDFVGRALFFKSCAVQGKAVVELLVWLTVPQLIDWIPTWLLVLVVLSDISLAIGCTWQYLALERQKHEDRQAGTDLGREVADAPE